MILRYWSQMIFLAFPSLLDQGHVPWLLGCQSLFYSFFSTSTVSPCRYIALFCLIALSPPLLIIFQLSLLIIHPSPFLHGYLCSFFLFPLVLRSNEYYAFSLLESHLLALLYLIFTFLLPTTFFIRSPSNSNTPARESSKITFISSPFMSFSVLLLVMEKPQDRFRIYIHTNKNCPVSSAFGAFNPSVLWASRWMYKAVFSSLTIHTLSYSRYYRVLSCCWL